MSVLLPNYAPKGSERLEGNGFTTKDMLLRLDEKLDKLDEKLDRKVDLAHFERQQEKVERRVVELEIKLGGLDDQVRIQDKVNAALTKKAQEIATESASNFTRKEKILMALIAIAALLLQAYVVTH